MFRSLTSKRGKAKSASQPDATDSLPFRRPTVIPEVELISDRYDMNHRRRGVAIILNHDKFHNKLLTNRPGTYNDVEALDYTLTLFGFEVRVYHDATRAQISNITREVCEEDHTDADCLAIFVLSHGEKNRLYAYDFQYDVEDLWIPFTRVASLVGKPKLIFLQACRGSNIDQGIQVNGNLVYADAASNISYTIPTMVDVMLMYSTVEGFVSYRNSTKGSPFIQIFCQEFNSKGNFFHFEDVMVHVKKHLAYGFQSYNPASLNTHNTKQAAQLISTLTKFVYFTSKDTRAFKTADREISNQISETHINTIKKNITTTRKLNEEEDELFLKAEPIREIEDIEKLISRQISEIHLKKITENITTTGKLNGEKDEFIKAPTCEDAVQVTVRKESRFYNMNHPRRGEAIIFSHSKYTKVGLRERLGTKGDEKILRTTLEKLKFKVTIHRDLTVTKLRKVLDDAAEKDYKDCDCLVVVVMSHGTDNKIYAHDSAYNVDDLWTPFTSNCKSLVGKPKLFFLQACRGNDIATGFFVRNESTNGSTEESYTADEEDLHVYTIPSMADVLVMYATAQGFVAFSGEETGSLFIRKICEELQLNSDKTHLEDMMLNVKRKMGLNLRFDTEPPTGAVLKQIPQLHSTLTRYVFFGEKMTPFKLPE